MKAALAIVPACALVAWFAWKWRGFVPPEFANTHAGFSLAAIPMTFALTGLIGGFYIWTLRSAFLRCVVEVRRKWMVRGFAIGTLAGLAARSDFMPWYRGFGIWLAVRVTPVVLGRSLLMLGLSIIGGIVAAAIFMLLTERERPIFGSAALFFMAAQCAHPAEFERYYEPFVLLLLILATALIAAREPAVLADRKAALGAAALTFLEAGYTVWRLSIPA